MDLGDNFGMIFGDERDREPMFRGQAYIIRATLHYLFYKDTSIKKMHPYPIVSISDTGELV